MSEGLKKKVVSVELSAELPFLKVRVSTQSESEELGDTLQTLSDAIAKSVDKLVALHSELMQGAPQGSPVRPETPPAQDDPMSLLAIAADVEPAKLRVANLVAIKGNSIQLYKATKFAASEAVILLAYASEKGLRRPSMPYEELKQLYKANGIKSKSPLYVVVSNLKRDKYIDRKQYDSDQSIVLTTKAENAAKDLIKQNL